MNCNGLADTGGSPFELLAVLALACVVIGALLVLAMRRRAGTGTALVLLLSIGVGALIMPLQPALASTPGCSTEGTGVRVIQTSTMRGLAPNIAPVPITGEVVNTGSTGIHITTVDVEIRSIAVMRDSAKGQCDPTDYTLLDRRMTVNRTLGVGQPAAFSGASIGFKNKPRTQDACQNATVHLHYTAHISRQ